MIRFLVFTVLFYVVFLIVSNLIKLFLAWKLRQKRKPFPQADAPSPSKPQVEYKNVEDAKFEDIPQPEHKESQTENNS
ncbi:MAG: hypothetical protein HY562_01910 [Ignavibacteriales bacterium]|nr:hypothetical protein [Ignavibacteriales bacterium]